MGRIATAVIDRVQEMTQTNGADNNDITWSRFWVKVMVGLFPLGVMFVIGQFFFVLAWGVRTDGRVSYIELKNNEQDKRIEAIEVTARRLPLIDDRQQQLAVQISELNRKIDNLSASLNEFFRQGRNAR